MRKRQQETESIKEVFVKDVVLQRHREAIWRAREGKGGNAVILCVILKFQGTLE